MPEGSAPSVVKRSSTSDDFKLATISPWSLLTTAGGVAAGANMAYHEVTSYPGTPDSRTVGTLDIPEKRDAPVTAIGRRFPACTIAIAEGSPIEASWM